MKKRTLQDRRREIRRSAGILVVPHRISQDLAGFIQPDLEIGGIGVAFAGHQQIIVAGEDQLHRPAGQAAGQGGEAGPGRGLILLASEPPADPFHVHFDQMVRHSQHFGDAALHHVGTLGGRIELDGIPLAGKGPGPLGLQVDMLLPPDVAAPFHHHVAGCPGALHIPQHKLAGGANNLSPVKGLAGIGNDRQQHDLRADHAGGPAGQFRGFRHHDGQRLAGKVHRFRCQQLLILDQRADLVFPGNVPGSDDCDHFRQSQGSGAVQPHQLAVRQGRRHNRSMAQPFRLRQIADIARGTAGVVGGVVVGHVCTPIVVMLDAGYWILDIGYICK